MHGPSLPSLVRLPPGSLPLRQDAQTRLLAPAEADGVRLMSYGFVGKGASSGAVPAAVMRGPMVGKTVGQVTSEKLPRTRKPHPFFTRAANGLESVAGALAKTFLRSSGALATGEAFMPAH